MASGAMKANALLGQCDWPRTSASAAENACDAGVSIKASHDAITL